MAKPSEAKEPGTPQDELTDDGKDALDLAHVPYPLNPLTGQGGKGHASRVLQDFLELPLRTSHSVDWSPQKRNLKRPNSFLAHNILKPKLLVFSPFYVPGTKILNHHRQV